MVGVGVVAELSEILALSVQHTGTRFLMKFLKDYRVKYRHFHTTDDAMKTIVLHPSKRAIVPLRDPVLSFMTHYNNPAMFNEDTLSKIVSQWKNLIKLCDCYQIQFLRLDARDTDREMPRFADFCGLDIEIKDYEWTPVRGEKNPSAEINNWGDVVHDLGSLVAGQALVALAPYRAHFGFM